MQWRRGDELFELTDALLCTDGPVHSLVGLCPAPEHSRGHGALYDALNCGQVDAGRLRQTPVRLPLPRMFGGQLVLAVDGGAGRGAPTAVWAVPYQRSRLSIEPGARVARLRSVRQSTTDSSGAPLAVIDRRTRAPSNRLGIRPGGFPRRNRRPSRQGDRVGVGACRVADPHLQEKFMSTPGNPLVTVTPPDTTPRVEVPVGDHIELPVRLALLEPTDAATATLDGAWWPRSRELATELPPLITVLGRQGIRLSRVAYHRENWEPAPRRLPADGRIVRLGWYPGLDPHLVRMTSGGGGRARLDLLVIPPDLDDAAGRQAMAAASQAGNHAVATAVLANIGALPAKA
jgi:hypothetical protein